MTTKLVIFDCDGVLVDSETITTDTIVEAMSWYGLSWNADLEHAVYVGSTSWNLEVSFPLQQFTESSRSPAGQVWGFNLARIRQEASEYAQWSPTYGSALRPDRFGLLVFD